jgi:hypothetical protein
MTDPKTFTRPWKIRMRSAAAQPISAAASLGVGSRAPWDLKKK